MYCNTWPGREARNNGEGAGYRRRVQVESWFGGGDDDVKGGCGELWWWTVTPHSVIVAH